MEKDDTGSSLEVMRVGKVTDRKEFISRAEACLEQDPALAVDLALERLQLYPDDAEAKMILGIGWYRKGEKEPALEVLRGLAEDVIRWSPAFGILSELCRDRGLDDEAERASRIFMSMNPESPEAIADLEGRLRRESRTYPEPGTEKSDEEVGLPEATDFKTLTLADLYARQGYRELAEALLQEILTTDPQNQDALERLRKLRPQAQQDLKSSVSGEGTPSEESQNLSSGAPGVFSFSHRLGSASGSGLVDLDKTALETTTEFRPSAAMSDGRNVVIGTLNRWLAALDRMKGNA